MPDPFDISKAYQKYIGEDPRMRAAVLKAFRTFSSTPENQKKIAQALPKILQKKLNKMFSSGDTDARAT